MHHTLYVRDVDNSISFPGIFLAPFSSSNFFSFLLENLYCNFHCFHICGANRCHSWGFLSLVDRQSCLLFPPELLCYARVKKNASRPSKPTDDVVEQQNFFISFSFLRHAKEETKLDRLWTQLYYPKRKNFFPGL